MLLSIVIVNWNTRDLLRGCLRSVQREAASLAPGEVETLVVDNNSSDGSPRMLEQEFPWASIIRNPGNNGFARANNQAIRQSKARFVLLLNPDTELLPGALRCLVDSLEGAPAVGAAGACLLNPDGTLQASASPAPTLLREFWRLLHLDAVIRLASYPLDTWNQEAIHEVDVAQGACLLLRRTALDQVGLLDEDYFMYTEEVDLCHRLRKAKWQVCWVPRARVIHYGGQSTRQAKTEMFLRLYESKVLYFRKNLGRHSAAAYKVILALASLPRLLVGAGELLVGKRDGEGEPSLASLYARLLLNLPRL